MTCSYDRLARRACTFLHGRKLPIKTVRTKMSKVGPLSTVCDTFVMSTRLPHPPPSYGHPRRAPTPVTSSSLLRERESTPSCIMYQCVMYQVNRCASRERATAGLSTPRTCYQSSHVCSEGERARPQHCWIRSMRMTSACPPASHSESSQQRGLSQ